MATKLENCSGFNRLDQKTKGESVRLKARGREWFFPGRTLIMGIINLSPDSFSGDGITNPTFILNQAQKFIDEGADILDVGAVSTRPGAEEISEEEEYSRLIPTLEFLKTRLQFPISVDTKNARIAERVLEIGCEFINDVSGLLSDPDMAHVVARYSAGVVIMHSRGNSKTMQSLNGYNDVVDDVCDEIQMRLKMAGDAGIGEEQIVIDPGIGFAKDAGQSYELLARLEEFARFNRPLLVGPSRKSFLQTPTGRDVGHRVFGTAAACASAILKGANILRVHDVGAMRDVARVCDEIMKHEIG